MKRLLSDRDDRGHRRDLAGAQRRRRNSFNNPPV